MGFFSFSLLKDPLIYSSNKIEPNKKYYSKDTALWKELKNRNKNKNFKWWAYVLGILGCFIRVQHIRRSNERQRS